MLTKDFVFGAVCSVLIMIGLPIVQPPTLAAGGGPPPKEPVAEITAPTDGQHLCDLTEVTGSANCKRFSHWTLSYKAIEDVGWIELIQSSSPAKNELLLVWDTSMLAEGDYDLRLAVYSNQKLEAEDTVPVTMEYLCGDCNGDFIVDPHDVDCFVDWLWNSGLPPCQIRAMDVDLSTQVDALDLAYLEAYLHGEGPAPCAWIIGDVDHDFWVSCPEDVIYLREWLWEDGPAPRPLESADVDCSGEINVLDLNYMVNYCEGSGPEPGLDCFVCGDFNHVGSVDWDDVIYLRNYLYEEDPPPMPLVSADVDGSCQVDALDLLYLIEYVIGGGPAPSCCPEAVLGATSGSQ